MTENNVRQIISAISDKLPQEKIVLLKNKLESVPDSRFDEIMYTNFHNPTHILLFSIFLGGIGVDRFMLGDVGLGIGKLLLGGLTCGIWPLIDIFMSYKSAKEKNFSKLMMSL